SGGEAQRVALTSALGSGLIHTLYVLDEPTSGLHRQDTQKVINAARQLQTLRNTVVVVEHDPQFIIAADEVIEIGPGAGEAGGQIVFQGTPSDLSSAETATGQVLRQQKHLQSVTADHGTSQHSTRGLPNTNSAPAEVGRYLTLEGVCCHNIRQLNIAFPLEQLCVVTGVSGSGKSSLIVDTLYPQLCRAIGQQNDSEGNNQQPEPGDHDGHVDRIDGYESLNRVLLLDQTPLLKSRRSVPVTWVGAFDAIRKLLAETYEARKRNYSAGMFSFNSSRGGRCPVCEGLGVVTIEMQFLADIRTTCEECGGRRFRPEVLEVRYRDRSVAEILDMTTDEAFSFFSGQAAIQQALNAVRQTGLGYVRLGQPLATLSGGEAQRLRIAALLAGMPVNSTAAVPTGRRSARQTQGERTLFLLDEPSTGLHMQDMDRLITSLNWLVQTGNSVIVVEHDEFLVQRADYVIELGPGAGPQGGQIIAAGPNIRRTS
ncbi:MAG: ATP-binding cassette domain-containing protein, partial [Planctomycetaceae bacterium]|nr:ATP-binding cassette domain-containing protein [Planctomycetaceae bacterium]